MYVSYGVQENYKKEMSDMPLDRKQTIDHDQPGPVNFQKNSAVSLKPSLVAEFLV